MPAITQALVPGPVIIKASIAPLLAPPDISVFMSGIADSPLIYIGKPTKPARGTAKTFPELKSATIRSVGTRRFIKYPTATNKE